VIKDSCLCHIVCKQQACGHLRSVQPHGMETGFHFDPVLTSLIASREIGVNGQTTDGHGWIVGWMTGWITGKHNASGTCCWQSRHNYKCITLAYWSFLVSLLMLMNLIACWHAAWFSTVCVFAHFDDIEPGRQSIIMLYEVGSFLVWCVSACQSVQKLNNYQPVIDATCEARLWSALEVARFWLHLTLNFNLESIVL